MIEVGMTNEESFKVERRYLASSYGSGLVDALATPVLVGFCEECARAVVDPLLPPGEKTVGVSILLEHLAPTPEGMTVTVTAKLIGVEGRRLRFAIEAKDELEPIGRGTHERYIIDQERFARRVAKKTKRLLPS